LFFIFRQAFFTSLIFQHISSKSLKNFIKKIKKPNWYAFALVVDRIIEHRLFKPVAIVIITSFILFKGLSYIQFVIDNYRHDLTEKRVNTPIKINISNSGVDFDVEEEQVFAYRVRQGDTMMKILVNLGVSESDVVAILSAMKKVFAPSAIVEGNNIEAKYNVKIGYDVSRPQSHVDRKVVINVIKIAHTFDEEIVISRKNDGTYDARKIEVKLLRYVSKYFGVIKNGLFVDGVESGISPTSMMNMISLYGYDVDFQRDIRSGDKFEMLVESFYSQDGKKVKDGNVLFSSLILQNRGINVYMHKIENRIEYFDAKGNSIRKSLLKTPINGARVSSGFGMRRHPILGYSKMHKGMDFAASSGTPILAAGNGIVVYMARKGGYGNYVEIRHNSEYSTAYGHASRFNKKFRVRAKVKQGDVVAYVGSTGRSTGPHLHFEVLYKGRQINPSKVKATSGIKLLGKELARFEVSKAEIEKYRKNIPNQIRR